VQTIKRARRWPGRAARHITRNAVITGVMILAPNRSIIKREVEKYDLSFQVKSVSY
jgi:hypothetical protein